MDNVHATLERSSVVESQIRAWVDKVTEPGFYLDALDGQLFAEHFGANLLIILDSPAEDLEMFTMPSYLGQFMPRGVRYDDDVSSLKTS